MSATTPMSPHKLALYFKELDPNTGITETAIRRLIKTGAVRSCKIGVKNLATPAAVEEFYHGNTTSQAEPAVTTGIRRLPERML